MVRQVVEVVQELLEQRELLAVQVLVEQVLLYLHLLL
tara:strand:+ start:326 stop:436 length:111 start_codon:yes stop_codon:yes gene_type:complete